MMLGFNIGLRALTAAQIQIDVTGNNIANVNTEGYSRQVAITRAARPFEIGGVGQLGTGVDVLGVDRVADLVLERRLRDQTQLVGRFETEASRKGDLEALLAEPSESGISSLLGNFFNAIGTLSSTPEDLAARESTLREAQTLSGSLRELASGFRRMSESLGEEIQGRVGELNSLAKTVADLNAQIAESEATGAVANGLRDVRQAALKEMSRFADLQAVDQNSGAVNVVVGGHLLVSSSRTDPLKVDIRPDGQLTITPQDGNLELDITAGEIKGLLDVREEFVTDVGAEFDRMAKSLIQEVNRLHATGVPLSGPYKSLTSYAQIVDRDGDGDYLDEKLNDAGLPYDPHTGELVVSITDQRNGGVTSHPVQVDADQSVGTLVQSLNEVPHLFAGVDASGRLQLSVEPGYGFDFSGRPDSNPNGEGTFGGADPTVISLGTGPFTVQDGDILGISVEGGFPEEVFLDGGTYTAEEMAAFIQEQTFDVEAQASNGRLILRAPGFQDIQVEDVLGNPSAALKLSTELEVASDIGVEVEVSGRYTGQADQPFTFVPDSDGQIGVDEGLTVGVFDANGIRTATLDIGAGYVPGEKISVGNGMDVSFTSGTVSATSGDFFQVAAHDNPDTADVLSSFQLGAFFVGSGVDDIDVHPELVKDPTLLAASGNGDAGDNTILLGIGELFGKELKDLDNNSIAEFHGRTVTTVGAEVRRSQTLEETQKLLLDSLEFKRQQVSGVSMDEEVVNLQRQQQQYEAAARYLRTVSTLLDSVINL